MPTFPATGPVTVRLRLGHGRATIAASDRDDVVVVVEPSDPSSRGDREHADATTVEQRGDRIVVEAPGDVLRGRRSVDVKVDAPIGSHLELVVSSADVRCSGALGTARLTTSSGDVSLEHVASLEARTSSGDTACRQIDGDVTATSASGDIVIGRIGRDGEFTTASGDLVVDDAAGELRARTASGDVILNALARSADVRTASGDVRIRSVRSGTIAVDTTSGDIEVGVATGVAAWLDVESRAGQLSSELDDSSAPTDGEETVSVVARSMSGNITITRAPATGPVEANRGTR